MILQAWLPAELAWWGRGAGWGAAKRCRSALLLLSPASLLLTEKRWSGCLHTRALGLFVYRS